MIAPISPLLIQEAWDFTPNSLKREASPFHRLWLHQGTWHDDQIMADMPSLFAANAAVKKAQEAARAEKKMGSSLQSFVTIAVDGDTDVFEHYRDDLETLFVVSRVDVCSLRSVPRSFTEKTSWCYAADFESKGLRGVAYVYAPEKAKCNRCWRYVSEVDTAGGDVLCSRCVNVIDGR